MVKEDFYADKRKYQRIESLKTSFNVPAVYHSSQMLLKRFTIDRTRSDGLDINAGLADGQTRYQSALLSKTRTANLSFTWRVDNSNRREYR